MEWILSFILNLVILFILAGIVFVVLAGHWVFAIFLMAGFSATVSVLR